MDNIVEVEKAIFIAVVVATFLLNTGRRLKAIELCKECLIILNDKCQGLQEEFARSVYFLVYCTMFSAYSAIADNTNAIQYGNKVLVVSLECGKTASVAVDMAEIYRRQNKHIEAKELYEKAIDILIKIGDRKGEADAYGKFGIMLYHLGEFISAKKYMEKALVISIEIGDRKKEAECYGNLGTVFCSLGEYHKAKEFHEKALVIRKAIGDRRGEAADYGNLGTVFHSLSEYHKAKEFHEKALVISKAIGDRQGEAFDYGNLGTVFLSLGDYHKAEEYLEKALEIKKAIGDRVGEAACYGNLGTVFSSLGEYHKAKEYHEKALVIHKAIGDRKGEAEDYGNLGTVFRSLGEYHKAKEFHEKALVIRKAIGDRNGEAADYGNLGTVFSSLGEYHKAKEYLEKSLVFMKAIGDRGGEAADYGNLGTVFQCLGEYHKAKEFHEKALVIRKAIGDRGREATDYGNLGTVFYSLGEYHKAKEFHEKALVIRKAIGDRKGEAVDYGNLGIVFGSLGEYHKAKECHEKALVIRKAIGDREGEAADYGNLGTLFLSLGEYHKAKEFHEKALVISKAIGDRGGEAVDYGNLGIVFGSLGEYHKAKEFLEKALVIRKAIGDRGGEAADYANLGIVFRSLGEYHKAKEYLEKALVIRKAIGDRKGEAADYGNLGTVFQCLGEFVKAEDNIDKALSICKDIGVREIEVFAFRNLSLAKLSQRKVQEAYRCLFQSIDKCEDLRDQFLVDNDQLKIYFSDRHIFPYQELAALFCAAENTDQALYVVELGRARALADLMAAQYSAENQISSDTQSWVGIESIMKKESDCTCLYIAYHGQHILLWILRTNGIITFRRISVNEDFVHAGSISDLEEFFSKSFRSFGILREDECEDRSLNVTQPKSKSSQQESSPALRLVEKDEKERQDPEPLFYKLIIAPVADLLEEPEIIIVPDRSLYQVPFAALIDESGKYLSETFRIRIVPSLTTLKLIQNSPADYHSQTGALIVGNPEVSRVFYKGRLTNLQPLPGAGKEAEMIGRLLGVQPLLGQHATKEAVLQRINSVSLIHFAAHGNADRGEIALTPVCPSNRIPQEEDYLLTMSDIAQVQLRAKLVVLSCCHSGRGQIRSEGAVGIARSFLGSGARSVLVALWALGDRATEQLMNCFYEHLVRGESASESLHEAMKWMRVNGYPKVCDWAPFMLIGDNVTFEFGKEN